MHASRIKPSEVRPTFRTHAGSVGPITTEWVSWPIRADYALPGGGALKRQELKPSVSDERNCSDGQSEGREVFSISNQ